MALPCQFMCAEPYSSWNLVTTPKYFHFPIPLPAPAAASSPTTLCSTREPPKPVRYEVDQDPRRYSLSDLYICVSCSSLRTPHTIVTQVESYYCPSCLRLYPSTEAAALANRCSRCFVCPECSCDLYLLGRRTAGAKSRHRSNSRSDKNDHHDKETGLPFTEYLFSCVYCKWNSTNCAVGSTADQLVHQVTTAAFDSMDSLLMEHHHHDKKETTPSCNIFEYYAIKRKQVVASTTSTRGGDDAASKKKTDKDANSKCHHEHDDDDDDDAAPMFGSASDITLLTTPWGPADLETALQMQKMENALTGIWPFRHQHNNDRPYSTITQGQPYQTLSEVLANDRPLDDKNTSPTVILRRPLYVRCSHRCGICLKYVVKSQISPSASPIFRLNHSAVYYLPQLYVRPSYFFSYCISPTNTDSSTNYCHMERNVWDSDKPAVTIPDGSIVWVEVLAINPLNYPAQVTMRFDRIDQENDAATTIQTDQTEQSTTMLNGWTSRSNGIDRLQVLCADFRTVIGAYDELEDEMAADEPAPPPLSIKATVIEDSTTTSDTNGDEEPATESIPLEDDAVYLLRPTGHHPTTKDTDYNPVSYRSRNKLLLRIPVTQRQKGSQYTTTGGGHLLGEIRSGLTVCFRDSTGSKVHRITLRPIIVVTR